MDARRRVCGFCELSVLIGDENTENCMDFRHWAICVSKAYADSESLRRVGGLVVLNGNF